MSSPNKMCIRDRFNHRTNVDIENRLVCYDIKELGKQMKKIGMLVAVSYTHLDVYKRQVQRPG